MNVFGMNPNYPNLNACLNWQGDNTILTLYGIADGFKLAGDNIVEQIIADGGYDIDKKIFPAVFLYRHFMEIALKELIERCLVIEQQLGKNIKRFSKNHKIKELLDHLNLMLIDISEISPISIPNETQEIIKEFGIVDESSMNFRYATKKDDSVIKHPIDYVSIPDLYTYVTIVYNDIDTLRNILDGLTWSLADSHELLINE
ncbi:MAG: hypothetical protein HHAS10_04430 [Candidatus Altimarinota bacterium]